MLRVIESHSLSVVAGCPVTSNVNTALRIYATLAILNILANGDLTRQDYNTAPVSPGRSAGSVYTGKTTKQHNHKKQLPLLFLNFGI